ncbi:MAG: universal stress protein [Bradymonadaceae bacterium]|nr:universal stress protein [Lujinxingiaceae bacterium]
MYKVEQVLVPVDFSNSSRCALEFARGLGSESPLVQLVHIVEPLAPYTRNILFPYAGLGEDEVEFEHEILSEAYEQLCRHFRIDKKASKGFIGEPIVRIGALKTLLSELVRTIDSHMIVMGAFGEGGMHPDALGSTAERLLRSVAQPVVLVRDFERSPRINHIVVAVDLTASSVQVFAKAIGLAIQTGASVETLFVLPSPFTGDSNKLLSSNIKFNAAQVLSRSEDKIDALFERLRQQIHIPFPLKEAAARAMERRQVLVGDPATEIVRHAYENNADLVVLGAHDPHTRSTRTLGRTAWTVARTSPTHVMIVPPEVETTLLSDDQ